MCIRERGHRQTAFAQRIMQGLHVAVSVFIIFLEYAWVFIYKGYNLACIYKECLTLF